MSILFDVMEGFFVKSNLDNVKDRSFKRWEVTLALPIWLRGSDLKINILLVFANAGISAMIK